MNRNKQQASTDESEGTYVIRGGADGRERLRLLSRIVRPTTLGLFEQIHLDPSAACLDMGCGGGDVCFELARLVGPDGRVLGVDRDAEQIAIARSEAADHGMHNVNFQVSDIYGFESPPEFDLAYGRFILTHLQNPGQAIAGMRRALAPGGVLAVEDIDFSGHFSFPRSEAFDRYIELYSEVVRRAGADPDIGPRLPGLLVDANLEGVGMKVVQPAGIQGEVKRIHSLTMDYIRSPVLEHGLATNDEIDHLVGELDVLAGDDKTVMSLPRIVQAWGFLPVGQFGDTTHNSTRF